MVINIKKIGKMFEIKRISKGNIVIRYARTNNIYERICMLLNKEGLNVY